MGTINDILPSELLYDIFVRLEFSSFEQLLAVSSTCKLWRRLIFDEWFLNKYFAFNHQKYLIGYWKFDEGHEHIGKDSSAIIEKSNISVWGKPTVENCFIGNCAVFDGRSSIDISVYDKCEYHTDIYSVSLWLFYDPCADGVSRTAISLYEYRQAWLQLSMFFQLGSIYVQNKCRISDGQYMCDGATSEVKQEEWFHVVLCFNRNRQQLWINGKLVNESDMSARNRLRQKPTLLNWSELPRDIPFNFHLGSADQQHSQRWKGKLADVVVLSRWLKPIEIRAIYTQKVAFDKLNVGTYLFKDDK
ncbi:unnamed protein product [Didymodactylos carnosus]|uniref:F-box domain-containing protein n=1 Tax=Didymodactylos carnosus TaxID=1234261 RepID=A0A814QGX9_9BILA|nr:unnamed protein product [Didymodactylos carnosus]CAF1319834.1 unnamed protein product [Didymodactylos carnosus]CAF3882589.1 unnamed protein product [Didymodactylos carnosus]CAF4129661.1 unnamed protein product [Didymodactylos carnosus]